MLKLLSILSLIILSISSVFPQDQSIFTCIPKEDLTSSLCNVYNITPPISKPNQPIRILGQIETFRDTSVTSLIFNESNILKFVPTNAFQYFPSIENVEFNNVKMTNLVRDAFANCEKLTTILVTNNSIKYVPESFARNCSELRNVTMTENSIKFIDENALEGLSKLIILDLSNNNLSCIPPKLFTKTPKIIGIFLRSNQITTIASETFKNLKNLIKIDLVNNKITFIPTMDFESTAVDGGFDFDLSNNPIYAIEPNFIDEFFANREIDENSSVTLLMTDDSQSCVGNTKTVVQNLNYEILNSSLGNCYKNWSKQLSEKKIDCVNYLSDETKRNGIDYISSTTEIPTTILETLTTTLKIIQNPTDCKATEKFCRFYLDHKKRYTCVIDDVDSIITSLSGIHVNQLNDDDVTRVYFTNSTLRNIPMIIFTKFKKLNFLSIRNCSLGIITKGTFKTCNNLSYLDVSYNEIIHVSKGALDKCEKLQTIDISGNPIDTLDQNYKTFIMNNDIHEDA